MAAPDRPRSTSAALARSGFVDADRAARLAAAAGLDDGSAVVKALAAAADPDLALVGLTRMLESAAEPASLRRALEEDSRLRHRLVAVCGASAGLTDHLARHGRDWRLLQGPLPPPGSERLRRELLAAVGAEAGCPAPVAGTAAEGRTPAHALRLAYRRRVLRLAARDLTAEAEVHEVTEELSDLAAGLLEAALAIARAENPEAAASCRLAVIGMGKCGARELNYVSDVDVVFVAEPAEGRGETEALQHATTLATRMMRIPADTDAEGTLWQVDPALRPEGKNGPLVRPLAGHRAYYTRWAKTWEFQALLKARPIAGDAELGAQYMDTVSPMVWQASSRDRFVEDVQAMRRRVEAHLPAADAERELKLGRGGLRDVEFAVQLLQLVHGRTDETLRLPATLDALHALSGGGYVGREDATRLAESYRLLRRVEHLVQLHRLRRTHLLPSPDTDEGRRSLRRIGRCLGYVANPGQDLLALWRRRRAEVRSLHEKLFYRPLLAAVARLPEEGARLSPEQAVARLQALGFADPQGALRHLEALSQGVTRRAAIQRTLLPVMLGYFADSPAPDAGLLGFRKVSEALGSTPWYLRLLRDDVRVAERMAHLLGTSRYATDLLLRAPEAVAMLGDTRTLAARSPEELRAEAAAALRRHDTADAAVAAVRALRRRELLRTAAAELQHVAGVEAVGASLTAISTVTVEAALRSAMLELERGGQGESVRFCVIAMGRFGGGELSYASDADVMFVYEPLEAVQPSEAAAEASAIARRLRTLLEMPTADPPLALDTDLRPEGRNGPEVRSLESYAAYYRRWSSTWESQALLRAVPVAGDSALAERFEALIDPVRYPPGGVGEAAVREIRRLKARMEAERLPRGADPTLHTKLGRGGLSDVEWVAQLIQLRHAHSVPTLRTPGTLTALRAARDAGLVDAEDAGTLEDAWQLASALRGAVMLVRGRGGDSVPSDARERAAIAAALGYEGQDGSPGERMVEDYLRLTRRARSVMERLFYDD